MVDGELAEAYEKYRGWVYARVREDFPQIDRGEFEDLYQEAWVVVCERVGRGEVISNYGGFLHGVLKRKAFKQVCKTRRRRTDPTDEVERIGDISPSPAEQVEARTEFSQLLEVVNTLPDPERSVFVMRVGLEYERTDICRALGLGRTVFYETLERACETIEARLAEMHDGRWCEGRRSVLLAHRLGWPGRRAKHEAELHLRNCAACARELAQVRIAAAFSPLFVPALPAPPVAIPDRAELAIDKGRELVMGLFSRGGAEGTASVSHLAVSAPRGAGSMALAAVCAAVAGGGGAAVCVQNGVIPDPIAALVKVIGALTQEEGRAPRVKVKATAASSEPPVASAAVAPHSSSAPVAASSQGPAPRPEWRDERADAPAPPSEGSGVAQEFTDATGAGEPITSQAHVAAGSPTAAAPTSTPQARRPTPGETQDDGDAEFLTP